MSYLLQIENVVVEIILQLFVCIVNAELLEAVGLKVLKAKNVQNTNGQTLQNKSKNRNNKMRRKEGNVTQFKLMFWQVCELSSLTGIDSSISFLLSSAWLMRSTIQSNKALYKDLAMESLAVIAW